MQPDSATTYLKQGQKFQRESQLAAAEAAYRQAIALNPIFYGSFQYLGEVLALQGKLGEAAEAYQRAKELNPKALWVHQRLGEVLLQQNRVDEAIAGFQSALEINPDFSWAYNGLGECWSLKGQWENAIAAYQKAVELNPNTEKFRQNLEQALASQNCSPIQEQLSFEVMEIQPDSHPSSDGQVTEEYRPETLPQTFEDCLELGKQLIEQGNLEAALTAFRQALKIGSNRPELYFQLGTILQQNNQIEAAIQSYEKLLELDLEWPEAVARIAKLNRELGIYKRNPSQEPVPEQNLSLSVVIPTYNRANSLRVTLPNYLKADRSDVEFVIIDNDSPDDTSDVVHSFMEQDKRIRYFRNSFNVGAPRNYFLGILYAKAPLIMLASDDDHITEGFVDLVIWAFENHPTVGATHNLAWPHERQNAFAANQRGGHLYQKGYEAMFLGPVAWTNLIGGITFRRTVINQHMWKVDDTIYSQTWFMVNIAINYDMYGLFCETEYVQQNVVSSSNPFEGMILLDEMAKGETKWDNGYPELIDSLLYRLWLLDLSPSEKPELLHSNASGCYHWLAYVIFPTWYSKSRDRAFTYLGVTLRYPYMRYSIVFWQHFVNSTLTTHCFNNIADRVFIILLGCQMLMWRLIIHLTECLDPGWADFFYVGQWPRKDTYDITASQGNRFGMGSGQVGYSASTVIKDLQAEIEL